MSISRTFVGIVVKVTDGTALVRVQRHQIHPRVEKFVTFYKNFPCINAAAQVGDRVRIESVTAVDPDPHFKISSILQQGERYTDPVTQRTVTYLPPGYAPLKPPPTKRRKQI